MISSPIAIAFVAPDGNWLRVNPALCKLLQYSESEILQKTFQDVTHPDDLETDLALVREVLEGKIDSYELEKRYIRADGSIAWIYLSVTAVRHEGSNEVDFFISQIVDLTEQKLLQEQLVEAANRDGTTGLHNRRAWDLLLEQECAGRDPFAILFIDLNDFKRVNDTRGHHEGDACLKVVGDRISKAVRAGDVVARVGGDEFCVLARGLDSTNVSILAGRIGEAISQPIYQGSIPYTVGAAIGIHLQRPGESVDEIMHQADLAMYEAKKSKGIAPFAFRISDEGQAQQAHSDLSFMAEVDRAIREREFVVHYQAIVELSTQETVGYEALVRWQHPEKGFLHPGEFLGRAISLNLMPGICKFVFEDAVATMDRVEGRFVSVNANPQTIPGFREMLSSVLAGADLSRLHVEITEEQDLGAIDDAISALQWLVSRGVSLIIDDFGAGYSLSHLSRIPGIKMIKIDRQITESMNNPVRRAIAMSCIYLAQALNIKVVAEGIETWEEFRVMQAIGCDYGQGYLFARPGVI